MAGKTSKWFNSLIGKSAVVSKPIPEKVRDEEVSKSIEIKPEQIKTQQAGEEDSVVMDIKNFKSFSKKLLGKTSTFLKPYAQKGSNVSSSALSKAGGLVDKSFLRKIVRIFLILLFLLILIFVAIRLFKTTVNNGGDGGIGREPTPTPINYQPYRPSLYNDDPEIKKLEEDINVLEGEISGTNIRESNLNPPSLDFNISF